MTDDSTAVCAVICYLLLTCCLLPAAWNAVNHLKRLCDITLLQLLMDSMLTLSIECFKTAVA